MRQIKRSIWLGVLLALLLAGCRHTKEVAETETETVTVTVTETITVTVTPSILPMKTEEELLAAVCAEEGQTVIKYFYDDFDGNGSYELFAFAANTDVTEGSEELGGSVYFVNYRAECQTLLSFLYIWNEDAIRCMEMEHEILFVADQAYASDIQSHVYGVHETQAVAKLTGGYIDQEESGDDVILIQTAYDICEDENGFFSGHSWKEYYFFYEEESRSFQEYGAIEITEEEFLSLTGSEEIINRLKEETNGEQTLQYYYRSNHTVQINQKLCYDTYTEYSYLNVQLDGTEIVAYTEDYGIYLPALYPEIAVYPETFLSGTESIQQ